MDTQTQPDALAEQIGRLTKTADELKDQVQAAVTNGEGFAEAKAQLEKVQEDLKPLLAKAAEERRSTEAKAVIDSLEALRKQVAEVRTPSKASLIGSLGPDVAAADDNFFTLVAKANSPKLAGGYAAADEAKARLEELGSTYAGVPAESKATVGDTDANGGYIVPNNQVAQINLQATAPRSVVDLFQVIDGLTGNGVDIPWESETISRAVIAAPGSTKENSNFLTNNYSATLYTLARIFDVGNQLLRRSQGAAERLVRSKLARAFALGEDYYALKGSGSSEPYGLLTALGTSGDYAGAFSSASNSTVAGSVIAAVLTAAGSLANRGAVPDGVVLNSGDYYKMARQGSDEAGFWRDPFGAISGPGQDVAGPGGLRWRHSPNMTAGSLVVGEFGDTPFFRGDGYRVDTSSEAGDRWDKNLTGFRGEEEIAFDARPAVYTGKFQRLTSIVP